MSEIPVLHQEGTFDVFSRAEKPTSVPSIKFNCAVGASALSCMLIPILSRGLAFLKRGACTCLNSS